MEKNVGGLDKKARVVLGPVLVAIGVAVAAGYPDVGLAGTTELAVTVLGLVAGAIFVVTGATETCPANKIAGIDTHDGESE